MTQDEAILKIETSDKICRGSGYALTSALEAMGLLKFDEPTKIEKPLSEAIIKDVFSGHIINMLVGKLINNLSKHNYAIVDLSLYNVVVKRKNQGLYVELGKNTTIELRQSHMNDTDSVFMKGELLDIKQ